MDFINSIKKLTVKIISKDSIGSGIIYCPSDDTDDCFIITARHCIHGEKFDNKATQKDIKLDSLYVNATNMASYQLTEDDEIFWEEDRKLDVALIRVSRKEIKSRIGEIPYLRFLRLSENKSECFFRGFPYWTENKFPRTVDSALEIRDDEIPNFHVKVKEDFTHYLLKDPIDLVKGLSGSGVCVNIKEAIYLYGIITHYEAGSHRFICQTIENLISTHCQTVEISDIEVERIVPENWFNEQLEISSRNMGPRYTWKNHYPVSLEKEFSTFGRDDNFKNLFHQVYFQCFEPYKIFQNEINSKYLKFISSNRSKRLNRKKYKLKKTISLGTIFSDFQQCFDKLDNLYNKINFANKTLQLKVLSAAVKQTLNYLELLISYFIELDTTINKSSNKKSNEANEIRSLILTIKSQLEKLWDFLDAQNRLANSSFLMISGKAGNGKSQLLAYVANQRAKQGYPSILILGQRLLRSTDPWEQILKELNLSCTSEEFLTALNKKGEALSKIIILFIDALNEGQGIKLWNQNLLFFLETISKYKWIRVVVSYRTSFKEALFRNIQLPTHIEFIHNGFLGVETEAKRFFFEVYNIKESNRTIFSSEFQNPLFLKLFCLSQVGGGFKEDINSFKGIAWIIDHFLQHVNEILALPDKFDYHSERLNLVKKVVEAFIKKITEGNKVHLNYEESFLLTEEIVNAFINKRGFINGLIDEEIFYENYIGNELVLDFSYEKFGDHLKVSYLLKDITARDLKDSFNEGGKLYPYFGDLQSLQENKGLIEALMIQMPEKYNLNLIDIIRGDSKYDSYISSLLYELVEGKKGSISPITDRYIQEQILNNKTSREIILDQILVNSSDRSQYFNAEFLHSLLMPLSMADRDCIWTFFLHDRFYDLQETTSVSSVIQRVLNIKEDDVSIEMDVIRLNGIVSCWFLSSSNRSLRDFSTKALIHLLSQRLDILIQILDEFENCNDPYITQRIYAIALGCVVRTKQLERLHQLCRIIFDKIFNQSTIVPDILLRDYARGCIEYAISIGLKFDFEIKKIRPPYKSPPFDNFPTNNDISKYLKGSDKIDGGYGLVQIMKSMVTEYGRGTSNYGDFGRYVFGSAVRYWKKVSENDLSNMAIQMIIEKYGYNIKKHGVFDSKERFGSRRRNFNQMERIGKKYQWISLFEILARLSDNYQFYEERLNDKPGKFEGPWHPYVRDIDPTTLIVKSILVKKSQEETNKLPSFDWSGTTNEWIKETKNIPLPTQMINFSNDDENDWLTLEFYFSLKEPKNEDDREAKEIWFQVRSYICKEVDYIKITNWAKRQNFTGRWMPESTSRYEMFNREFYWAPSAKTFKSEYYSGIDWQTIHAESSGKNIGNVAVTTTQYNWERENDMSQEHGLSFYKPSRFLFELMKLKYSEKDGELLNQQNKLVCFDSSLTSGGSQRLVINKKELLSTLKKNGLKIFWTILGEKLITGNHQTSAENIPGKLEISGLITESNGKLSDNLNFYKK